MEVEKILEKAQEIYERLQKKILEDEISQKQEEE